MSPAIACSSPRGPTPWERSCGRPTAPAPAPASSRTDNTGSFPFFDQANVELLVKLLDGQPVNGRLWLFYGALSDVEYWIDVTDTATGKVKSYHNPPGTYCGKADTRAF